jgi:hypothetical protein
MKRHNKKIVRGGDVHVPVATGGRLRAFDIPGGLPTVAEMREEVQDMLDVLAGRKAPPIDVGLHTMQEVADGYFARGAEWVVLIYDMEDEFDDLPKNNEYTKFRTRQLRQFLEVCKKASELGSRRLTAEQIRLEQEIKGRESAGWQG